MTKMMKDTMMRNVAYFNEGRKRGLLSLSFYIDGGDKVDIIKDGKVILSCVTIENAYYAVAAICNFVKGF